MPHSPVCSSGNDTTGAVDNTEPATCSVAELLLCCGASTVLLACGAGAERAAGGCAAQSRQEVLQSLALPPSDVSSNRLSAQVPQLRRLHHVDVTTRMEWHACLAPALLAVARDVPAAVKNGLSLQQFIARSGVQSAGRWHSRRRRHGHPGLLAHVAAHNRELPIPEWRDHDQCVQDAVRGTFLHAACRKTTSAVCLM